MHTKVLAIFDFEERYAYGLMEYLEQKSNLPFRVHVFTQSDKFDRFQGKDDIECLLIAESAFSELIEKYNIPHIIILSESGNVVNTTLCHIDKYQSCENIYKEILRYYTEVSEDGRSILRHLKKHMKIIGIYTPVGRCLQTTFAITLGQMLSMKAKTLYLNFERYSGLSRMLSREFNSDISDLVYYFECAKEKLAYKVDTLVEKIGKLDFIPPTRVYQNLAGIRAKQWIELLSEMDRCTDYEYLILDLTDGMTELWEVLRICDVVYTITKGDPMAMAKVNEYESAIELSGYPDVLAKTKKCSFPLFHHLPQRFDELTRSDLAAFIKDNIMKDIESVEFSE